MTVRAPGTLRLWAVSVAPVLRQVTGDELQKGEWTLGTCWLLLSLSHPQGSHSGVWVEPAWLEQDGVRELLLLGWDQVIHPVLKTKATTASLSYAQLW